MFGKRLYLFIYSYFIIIGLNVASSYAASSSISEKKPIPSHQATKTVETLELIGTALVAPRDLSDVRILHYGRHFYAWRDDKPVAGKIPETWDYIADGIKVVVNRDGTVVTVHKEG